MKTWFVSVLVLIAVLSGCSFLSKARITEMTPGMSGTMDKLECWLTIEFKKYPKNIDLNDVKVRFSSIALQEDEVFDWAYIAAHDVISLGFMKGFKENTESTPERNPPLDIPIKVNYPLNAKPHLILSEGETILMKAELFWGGKKVDSSERTIEHVYRPV